MAGMRVPGPQRSPFGGATWSHQPPFSSNVITTIMSFHCGEAFKWAMMLATCWSPDSMSE